jgi:hypothetical protein
MTESDLERDLMVQEARAFYLSAPLIMPIIEKKSAQTIQRLRLAHSEGKTDHTALVAELYAYESIKSEIEQKDQLYRSLEEKHVKTNARRS